MAQLFRFTCTFHATRYSAGFGEPGLTVFVTSHAKTQGKKSWDLCNRVIIRHGGKCVACPLPKPELRGEPQPETTTYTSNGFARILSNQYTMPFHDHYSRKNNDSLWIRFNESQEIHSINFR